VPADVGVPVNETVLLVSEAVSPVGKPLCACSEYGPVPPLTVIVPLKPDWPTVQLDTLNAPRVSEGLIVMENVCVLVAPVESLIVTEPDENVPADVGVPVNETVLLVSEAVSPVGKPLCACSEYGPVPPLTVIVPLKPDWPTVQLDTLNAPRVGAGLIVMLYVRVAMSESASVTLTETEENVPAVVGVPVNETVPSGATDAPIPGGKPLEP
jgi:hypothetical protein